MERFFGDRNITLYASGTAALAQAILNCVSRSSAKSPEIIIPAYGCPDLVAACVYASVHPRLVDISPSHWSYDLTSLSSSLSPNTVGIVAVNLLGLGDGSAELIRLCKDSKIPLIQDSAQYLPRESIDWPGDYIVLSFGRGKPLNLLNGGALVSPLGDRVPPSAEPIDHTTRTRLLSGRAAAITFNILTHPAIYRIFSVLPGTGVGQVVYNPLTQAARLPESAWQRVGAAFELYRQKASYRRDIWASAIKEWVDSGIVPLDSPGSPLPAEPLRLPLLAPNRAARDRLLDEFNRAGLGASRFYGSDITGIARIPQRVKHQGPFPNASALAHQLFTLPTHTLVTAATVDAARELVLAWSVSRPG